CQSSLLRVCIFFLDPAPQLIYTLSLHDALPIFEVDGISCVVFVRPRERSNSMTWQTINPASGSVVASYEESSPEAVQAIIAGARSEEHTSELQSLAYLVCRLLLEKKNLHRPLHK